ncbi:MAG: site-2 protease family protein [Candidatus Levybacteria bacterium]|nr:site-2 protease family protein [Candidatus Levybacteria bacterium]
MDFTLAIVSLVILIFSAILHEIAHGFVAERLGDPTARLAGRLTLNPKSHIDPLMSIALPLILLISGSPIIIGAAKPVPVDPFNLRDGRKDLAIVSLSGPLTNILLAVIASFAIKLIALMNPLSQSVGIFELLIFLKLFLTVVVQLNLLLAIFNLLPIPPLDGSKVFALLLPEKLANAFLSLGAIGIFIIFFLLLSPGELSLGRLIFTLLSFSERLLGL